MPLRKSSLPYWMTRLYRVFLILRQWMSTGPALEEDLLKQKQQSADLQIQQYVLKNVVENSKFKLNKNTLSRRYNDRIKQYEEQAKMYGTNLSGMAKANGMDVPGITGSCLCVSEG